MEHSSLSMAHIVQTTEGSSKSSILQTSQIKLISKDIMTTSLILILSLGTTLHILSSQAQET
jgi:hypothetical protein